MFKSIFVFVLSFAIMMATYFFLTKNFIDRVPIAAALSVLITALYRFGRFPGMTSFIDKIFDKRQ